jgi:hypothetical protein
MNKGLHLAHLFGARAKGAKPKGRSDPPPLAEPRPKRKAAPAYSWTHLRPPEPPKPTPQERFVERLERIHGINND